MIVKTKTLTGVTLDYAVAMAEKIEVVLWRNEGIKYAVVLPFNKGQYPSFYTPSSNWDQSGPIIDRELIAIKPYTFLFATWGALSRDHQSLANSNSQYVDGEAPIIAAMRCYVLNKIGEEIDIPDELAHTEILNSLQCNPSNCLPVLPCPGCAARRIIQKRILEKDNESNQHY